MVVMLLLRWRVRQDESSPLSMTKFVRWLPHVVCAFISGIYILIVGPYLEVPADVWQHLGAIQDYKRRYEFGIIDSNQPWYLIYTMALSLSGEKIYQTVEAFTIAGTIFFTVSICDLSRRIYIEAGFNPKRAALFGIIASLLTVGMFGTSVFSFARYYVFAPGYFSYLIFLLAAFLVVSFPSELSSIRRLTSRVALIGIAGIVTYLVHKQEALFLIIVLFMYWGFQISRQCFLFVTTRINGTYGRYARSLKSISIVVTIVLIVCVIYILSFPLLLTDNSFLVNNTIAVSPMKNVVWILADPTGRAYETLGIWGLIILAIYFGILDKDSRLLIISLLAIAPFLLLFNPIFTSMFLSKVSHDLLWRFTYMIPIGLIGAHILLVVIKDLPRKKPRNMVLICLIILGMIPWRALDGIQNSRWSTVTKISEANSYEVWNDLIDELRKSPARNILTDPITGYVVRAITDHTVFGFKFHESHPFIPINYAGYGPESFKGYRQWYFIENRRQGSLSKNGAMSGHWPEDVLKVSQNYSPGLIKFLESPPIHFALIWENDGIKIFEIKNQ